MSRTDTRLNMVVNRLGDSEQSSYSVELTVLGLLFLLAVAVVFSEETLVRTCNLGKNKHPNLPVLSFWLLNLNLWWK